MSSDERRRLADLARQLEREAPELSLALTDPSRPLTSRLYRRTRQLTGFEPRRVRRSRQAATALLLVASGLTLTAIGLTRQIPLLFAPGLILAAIVPLLWIAEISLTTGRWVVRYYANPLHRPPP